MTEKTVKRNNENAKKNKPEKENYYALLAVILNPKLSVDDAIRYFRLQEVFMIHIRSPTKASSPAERGNHQ